MDLVNHHRHIKEKLNVAKRPKYIKLCSRNILVNYGRYKTENKSLIDTSKIFESNINGSPILVFKQDKTKELLQDKRINKLLENPYDNSKIINSNFNELNPIKTSLRPKYKLSDLIKLPKISKPIVVKGRFFNNLVPHSRNYFHAHSRYFKTYKVSVYKELPNKSMLISPKKSENTYKIISKKYSTNFNKEDIFNEYDVNLLYVRKGMIIMKNLLKIR